jgi:sec-independent protein translocase protein TatB
VFDGVGWGEIIVLLLIGLFVFGPDRLPKAARDAARLLRQLRQMATGVRNDIRSELGPELADLDIRTLHPKTFIRKHLLEDDDELLLPPYLTKRGALDKMLFDDADDPPLSLRKNLGRPTGNMTAVSLAKSAPSAGTKTSPRKATATALSKAGALTPGPLPTQQAKHAGQPPPTTPYDLDAT